MGTSAANSLSIIIPALNEEKNIREACLGVAALAEQHLSDYEILVFDDASQDRTADVVRELQKHNSKILLFQNPVNRGLGYNYWAGIDNARCPYALMVPGDNEVISESLHEIFQKIGTSDIIISYSTNPKLRPLSRQIVSNLFTGILNLLFGLKVRYYNGPCVIRTDFARKFRGATTSFAYMAVLLIKLLKSGASYQHLTFTLQARKYGRTSAFRLKNIINVINDILQLFWKIQVRNARLTQSNTGVASC
ncbi:MAG: glycosyltransferase family 2 protein [Candidatus Omnitrophica bacterium]|nr:glycosyltransferase family 2 protein [Candidatus Omnitrophota bacterium]